ncbi:MAG TPA: 23S rRNA (guanosine(2251)-2'-O)-methyltransferase RlmB, partial [Thermomicrobiaceae bacterium]|nr:23S rRNA (guanosine(2251)-2'-O)-methyltransferase RlmB [Thermomicrobiaceae bacterium]
QRPKTGELLYGRNAVIEGLRGRRTPRSLYLAEGAERQERIANLLAEAQRRRLPVKRLKPPALEQLAPNVNHQGVLLEVGGYPYVQLDELLAGANGRPLVVLDHIQDVQNFGTLIRTADATGAAGLIIPDRRGVSVTPAVVNSSAGAVEHVAVARTPNLARAVDEAKEAGYWVVGLAAEPQAEPIFRADIPTPALLLIGSEGGGIGPSLLKHCDLLVRLPMLGNVESLNAAVAGSVALYELLRRRLEAD